MSRSDTSPEMAARARAIVMARTPSERAAMASEMSVSARALVAVGVRMELGPDASELDVRRAVFVRFYGGELGAGRAAALFDAVERSRLSKQR